ncbi:hypothetical protein ACH9EU_09495 [Kocuria sp. M1R5S2]|uniref:hypothetical protein n=1 Tax=Kocuria rhizosphaerae TaxID=3376285 RepID=UPI0037B83327
MRWPWQRKVEAPAPGTPPEASSAVPPAADGPAPSPAGWAFLPPLQRTVGELATTTAPHRFPDRLPTRNDPSFTGTMSHLISADAPAGLIDLDGPDAGPAPEPPGSTGRSVEMTLLPPPAPPAAGASRPVQRLAPAVQRSLTSAPEGDFAVLQLPVVGPTGPGTEPSAGPAGGAPAGPHPGRTAGGPGPAVAPPPVQRSVPGRPVNDPGHDPRSDLGGNSRGNAVRDSGGTFDGTATTVPLPRPGTPLQRTADTASSGAASTPLRPPGRPSPQRLGLGRPWPAHDPDPAGSGQPSVPLVARAHDSAGLPPAVPAAPPATEGSSAPVPEGTGTSARAEGRVGPVVSRSPVAEPPAHAPAGHPGGGSAVPGGSPPTSPPGTPTGDCPAPFADPPLSAGPQLPDPRHREALPVVSRAPDGVDPGTGPAGGPGTAPGDDGGPAGDAHPDHAGAGAPPLPSAPAVEFPRRSPPADHTGGGPAVLPMVSRAATSFPVAGTGPGTSTAAGGPAVPSPARGRGSATSDSPRPAQRAVEAPVPGSSAATPGDGPPPAGPSAVPRAGHPARTLGLRPSLPVVSRSAVDGPAPGSARAAAEAGQDPSYSPATATGRAPGGPARPPTGLPVAGSPAMPPTDPAVSRSAESLPASFLPAASLPAVSLPAAGMQAGAGPVEAAALSGRAAGGGQQTGGPPVLVARAVAVAGEGKGSPPDASSPSRAPLGTLQRSAVGRENLQHPPGLPGSPARAAAPSPAPGAHSGAADGTGGAGEEPVAMLLALPDRGSPRTDPVALARHAVLPTVRPAVQRQEVPQDTVPSPAHASSGGPEPVQRVGEEPGATPPEPGPAPAAPAAAAAAPGEAGMSQEQVDALAKRLVGPIVRRIKADMLLDRERRGLRIDVG